MSEKFSDFQKPIVVGKKRFQALAWQLVQNIICSDLSMKSVCGLLDCLSRFTKFSCRIISDEGHEWTWKFSNCRDKPSESAIEHWNRWFPKNKIQ